ncbi:3-oxo-5a-steroid 4- dehydrogenase [Spiromyces aspiralis]|uniref:3-oxo-5a-steroid 4- dehydrogenase n=1 Tax=Spiromyces aspiralis TaxID=68401 RepID=A0ACC1HUR5_9FUNG|nr:3-oxo-5a-steroid 4- dehydrogenase [Spiromyces aspiralis]
MKLNINPRVGNPFSLEVDGPETTVKQLKDAIQKKRDKKTVLDDKENLSKYKIKDGDTISFKDIGPQISWKAVYLIEYLGPILAHYILFTYPDVIYGVDFEYSAMQKLAYWLVIFHYAKREYETLFVHRFSHGTMPLFNLFKNSAHYWVLGGCFLAYFIYGPWLSAETERGRALSTTRHLVLWSTLFVLAELGNAKAHQILRDLRPKGSAVRRIPYGLGFNFVSCPNYLFEFLTWVSFCFLTSHWSAWAFTVVGTAQMYVWAVKKHKQYLKDFPDYPKDRTPMFPLIG